MQHHNTPTGGGGGGPSKEFVELFGDLAYVNGPSDGQLPQWAGGEEFPEASALGAADDGSGAGAGGVVDGGGAINMLGGGAVGNVGEDSDVEMASPRRSSGEDDSQVVGVPIEDVIQNHFERGLSKTPFGLCGPKTEWLRNDKPNFLSWVNNLKMPPGVKSPRSLAQSVLYAPAAEKFFEEAISKALRKVVKKKSFVWKGSQSVKLSRRRWENINALFDEFVEANKDQVVEYILKWLDGDRWNKDDGTRKGKKACGRKRGAVKKTWRKKTEEARADVAEKDGGEKLTTRHKDVEERRQAVLAKLTYGQIQGRGVCAGKYWKRTDQTAKGVVERLDHIFLPEWRCGGKKAALFSYVGSSCVD